MAQSGEASIGQLLYDQSARRRDRYRRDVPRRRGRRATVTRHRSGRSGPSAATCTSSPIGCTPSASRPSRWNRRACTGFPCSRSSRRAASRSLLVNARDVKHVPGRKTDVNDAQWLQQLHQYGLLRGSFRPREAVVQLRAYLRHRERLVEYAASHIQHMQKALMQMNVQLHHAVTDITGPTGMRIIRAIVAGERMRPRVSPRIAMCGAPPPTRRIREALTGNYRPEHVFALRAGARALRLPSGEDRRM